MRKLPRPLERVFFTLCEDLDTPRSLACFLLAKYGEWDQLLTLRIDPSHYSTAESFWRDNAATEFLRKIDLPLSKDKSELEAECWARFKKTELQCAATNARLSRISLGPYEPRDMPILEFIERVKRRVSRVLGPIPDSLECGFGPGATLGNPGRLSTIPDKIQSKLQATDAALRLWTDLYRRSTWYKLDTSIHQGQKPEVVRSARFFTVHKDALKLRGAMLSPVINGFLQKGIGRAIKARLVPEGISIDRRDDGFETPSHHRELVKDLSFATIDLSDASNTISRELVRLLLPDQWFTLLDSCRERSVIGPDGIVVHLEMFSAMGNGFTFELETMLFYCIVKEICGKGYVSVFGDDIICPRECADDVLAGLRWFGFTPNPRKTFHSGLFRESCGCDAFDGVPVRAHYVKTSPATPEQWIALANGIRRMAFGDHRPATRRLFTGRAWSRALDNLPSHIRCLRGPPELGDLVVADDSGWIVKVRDCIRYVRAYAPVSKVLSYQHFTPDVHYLSALYGCPSEGVIPRGSVSGYKPKWVPYS